MLLASEHYSQTSGSLSTVKRCVSPSSRMTDPPGREWSKMLPHISALYSGPGRRTGVSKAGGMAPFLESRVQPPQCDLAIFAINEQTSILASLVSRGEIGGFILSKRNGIPILGWLGEPWPRHLIYSRKLDGGDYRRERQSEKTRADTRD